VRLSNPNMNQRETLLAKDKLEGMLKAEPTQLASPGPKRTAPHGYTGPAEDKHSHGGKAKPSKVDIVSQGVPHEFRDVDWKEMPVEDRIKKLGHLDRIRQECRNVVVELQHGFSEHRTNVVEVQKQNKVKYRATQKSIDAAKVSLKEAKKIVRTDREALDKKTEELQTAKKQVELHEAALDREELKKRSLTGGGHETREQQERKQQETNMHQKIANCEKKIFSLQESEEKLRFELAVVTQNLKMGKKRAVKRLGDEKADQLQVDEKQVVYDEARKLTLQAEDQLAQAEAEMETYFKLKAEAMGVDLKRAQLALHHSRGKKRTISDERNALWRVHQKSLEEKAAAEAVLALAEQQLEDETFTVQREKDEMGEQMRAKEDKVKKARQLEREIDLIVKEGEKHHKAEEQWRARDGGRGARKDAVKAAEAKAEADKVTYTVKVKKSKEAQGGSPSKQLSLPRIGAKSAMS